MALELIDGKASESANHDVGSFFAGSHSLRGIGRFDESCGERYHRVHDFLEEAFAGRKTRTQIAEAFSTSDFTLDIFAAINTKLMDQYEALPSAWRSYTAVMEVPDFRPTRLLDKWVTDNYGLQLVPELTEYPTAGGAGFATYWINVAKYGLRDSISWEAFINDSAIGELQNAPTKYARAAAETEAINALGNLLSVGANGQASTVNTDLFKSANGNAPDTRALTADNLDAVLGEITLRKPSNKGRLVSPPDLVVVIPKALEPQMRRIRALREIRVTDSGTGTTQVFDNYLANSVDYVVEPMLDAIFTHAKAATTWFVLPKPTTSRPATFAAFLRGHTSPEFRYKVNAGQAIGGGQLPPEAGSFEIDDIQTRVRHVLGRQHGDPLFTYVSYGS